MVEMHTSLWLVVPAQCEQIRMWNLHNSCAEFYLTTGKSPYNHVAVEIPFYISLHVKFCLFPFAAIWMRSPLFLMLLQLLLLFPQLINHSHVARARYVCIGSKSLQCEIAKPRWKAATVGLIQCPSWEQRSRISKDSFPIRTVLCRESWTRKLHTLCKPTSHTIKHRTVAVNHRRFQGKIKTTENSTWLLPVQIKRELNQFRFLSVQFRNRFTDL